MSLYRKNFKAGEAKRSMPRLASSLGAEQGANQHFLVGNGGFVQIDLPVHQAAGGEEVLNRIDAFGLYYQVVILHPAS